MIKIWIHSGTLALSYEEDGRATRTVSIGIPILPGCMIMISPNLEYLGVYAFAAPRGNVGAVRLEAKSFDRGNRETLPRVFYVLHTLRPTPR